MRSHLDWLPWGEGTPGASQTCVGGGGPCLPAGVGREGSPPDPSWEPWQSSFLSTGTFTFVYPHFPDSRELGVPWPSFQQPVCPSLPRRLQGLWHQEPGAACPALRAPHPLPFSPPPPHSLGMSCTKWKVLIPFHPDPIHPGPFCALSLHTTSSREPSPIPLPMPLSPTHI